MQTIIIKLDSEKLINADLDMRYKVPDYIETYTDGVVTDNGYDYVNESGTELAIWLDTKDAAAGSKCHTLPKNQALLRQ